ncbi:GNAT family N-acetyltransferase [Aquirufa antheringensis]|uniref:GNAT family N-acetyltransferase n=1 Tax=Aquirufa antheringensis TaxID=2516559 RepID=UPI00208F4469|nr:GNAT family N-acetyltransferase [Aquirufa antheringensis]USQ03350.1 GNAT family N-acetyltransferase [Aquirufa antheringensis]
MLQQEIIIRPYKSGDAEKIFSLFQRYTDYQRDEAFWVWINRLLTYSIISVAELKGEIVGHYAILPRTCRLQNGTLLHSGLGIHAFVEPQHRDKVSIFSISSIAYKLAKERGIQFIYGFPNKSYRLIQEKIERWNKVAIFNALVKKPAQIPSSLKFNWKKVEEHDYLDLLKLNELFEKSELKYNGFLSGLDYWHKRYLYHPQKLYEMWKLDHNNLIVGFLVTKLFKVDGFIRLHVIDFQLRGDLKLIDFVPDIECKFSSVTEMVFWPFNIEVAKSLRDYGYVEEGFDTYFGIKILDKSIDDSLILNYRNWHLTMGDSDAF